MFSRSSPSFIPLASMAVSFIVLAYVAGLLVKHPFIAIFAMGLVFTQRVFPFAFDLLHDARTTRGSQFARALGRAFAFGAGVLAMGMLLAFVAVLSVQVAHDMLHIDTRAVYLVSGAINVFAYVTTLSGLGFIARSAPAAMTSILPGWLPGRAHAYMRAFWMGMRVLTVRGVGQPLVLSLFASSLFVHEFLHSSAHYFIAVALGVTIALVLLAVLARVYVKDDLAPRFAAVAPSLQHVMLWVLVFATTRDVIMGFFGVSAATARAFFEARIFWAAMLGFPVMAYWAKEAWHLLKKKAILTEAEWGNFFERTALVALIVSFIILVSRGVI